MKCLNEFGSLDQEEAWMHMVFPQNIRTFQKTTTKYVAKLPQHTVKSRTYMRHSFRYTTLQVLKLMSLRFVALTTSV
jgi:hypothetical protein